MGKDSNKLKKLKAERKALKTVRLWTFCAFPWPSLLFRSSPRSPFTFLAQTPA